MRKCCLLTEIIPTRQKLLRIYNFKYIENYCEKKNTTKGENSIKCYFMNCKNFPLSLFLPKHFGSILNFWLPESLLILPVSFLLFLCMTV